MANESSVEMLASKGLSEILIGPDSARTRVMLNLFHQRLVQRGFEGEPIWFESAECIGVIVPKETIAAQLPSRGSNFEFHEDQWPEALGFCARREGNCIEVESDHFSIRPMYWARSGSDEFVGSSLQWVAAATEQYVDSVHAVEFMLVTFNLDDRTLVRGVQRMNPGQKWVKCGSDPARMIERVVGIASVNGIIEDSTGSEARELLEGPAKRVAQLMDEGACIELSGGMDSRCNLALGNWVESTPRFAFTLGNEGDEEVDLARELCRLSGVEHRRLGIEINHTSLDADTDDYLESACYQVNAASYCWMPELFRTLAPDREIQLCGQMASTGFFYTPFDALARFESVIDQWVMSRLIISGNRSSEVFGGELVDAGMDLVRTSSKELIARADGSFRDSTDEFFIYQRNRQWAGVVAHAARYWYRNQVPLLDHRVAEWAWRGRMRERAFRVNQMRLCEDLGVVLAGVPFDGGIKCPASRLERTQLDLRVLGKIAGGVYRRLKRTRRNPDTGADEVAKLFVGLPNAQENLVSLLSEFSVPNAEQRADAVCNEPGSFEREIGFLVTTMRLNEHIAKIVSATKSAMRNTGSESSDTSHHH